MYRPKPRQQLHKFVQTLRPCISNGIASAQTQHPKDRLKIIFYEVLIGRQDRNKYGIEQKNEKRTDKNPTADAAAVFREKEEQNDEGDHIKNANHRQADKGKQNAVGEIIHQLRKYRIHRETKEQSRTKLICL
ncbi:MAG: hypothetical protein MJ033_05445 [Victivallaceae bacterium]|nr:hypothetical protein [Victivallaceae bacterium]